MASNNIEGPEQVERLEETLQPCINVIHGKSYKVVLEKAIEVYKSSGGREGVSFYSLYYKDRVLSSKDALERALRTLSECGYLIYKETSSKTKSKKKRKDYYPTPLGILMNKIVKFRERCFSMRNSLSQQARDDPILVLAVGAGVSYVMKPIVQEVYNTTTNAYTLTIRLYQDWKTPLPPHIVTAYKTVFYVIEQSRIILLDILEDLAQDRPDLVAELGLENAFIEAIKKQLDETKKELEDSEHTYKQILNLLTPELNKNEKEIGDTVLSAIRDLKELYEDLRKYLEFTKEWSDHHSLKHT